MSTYPIPTLGALFETVDTILASLPLEGGAVVLALHGDLGAGKTTTVQIIADKLGVVETVTSPTFVILKRYDTEHKFFSSLVHIDAYRIEDMSEVRPLQLDSYVTEPRSFVCIEWAERIAEVLPAHTLHLYFSGLGEERTLTIT